MKLFEFCHKEGFKEIEDFIWNTIENQSEGDDDIFARLGYSDEHVELFSDLFAHWISVFRSDQEKEYEFIICLNNHFRGDYVFCRSHVDYLEFLRTYLPTIEAMNRIADETEKRKFDQQ